MSEILKSNEQHEGWKDETNERAEQLQTFLAEALRASGKKSYASTELHFSGTSPLFQDVQKGTARPSSVRVQYQNGTPVQVHAYYLKDERGGQNLDVYLSQKALTDFLKKQ